MKAYVVNTAHCLSFFFLTQSPTQLSAKPLVHPQLPLHKSAVMNQTNERRHKIKLKKQQTHQDETNKMYFENDILKVLFDFSCSSSLNDD